jgi:hypothetical protein
MENNIVYNFPLNTEIPAFTGTPKPRELTEEETNNFGLKYYGGKEMNPVFEHTGSVWCASDNGKLPTYRLYNCGTNCLKVLKYTLDRDVWEEIELDDIDTLYGFVWNMCLKLENPIPFDMTTTLVSGGNYYEQ